MSEFQPTEQQKIALNQIRAFLARPGSGVFILKGYAGTGKTTLLQELAKELDKNKSDFALLAPTGRAAAVLRAKTGFSATTVHSELYHFYDVDGEPIDKTEVGVSDFGQMRLMFSIRTPDEDKKLYIVDEASMLTDDAGAESSFAHFGSGHLLSDLMQAVGSNKVIFSGDPSQLPPVGSIESPALTESWFRHQGKVVVSYELTDILRQKAGSPILRLATIIRAKTQQNYFEKWQKIPAYSNANVHLMTFLEQRSAYLQHIKLNGFDDAIAICSSNRNVSDINTAARQVLWGSSSSPLREGDLLMVTQNNYRVPLVNGDFVTVVNVGQRERKEGISFIRVTVKAQATGAEHETLLCEQPLIDGAPNLSSDQQRALMIAFSMELREKGVKPKSQLYKDALRLDPYLNSLRANYGYGVTCHKSQGGEWDHVFFFLNKGMYVMKESALPRWWYTGITRAKQHLYLVNDWWIE